HERLATVWDAGLTDQNHVYCVREYLPPSGLFSVDPMRVTELLVSAIDFLCRHGRIHGALKPSNIFVAQENLKLADIQTCQFHSSDDEEFIHFSAPEVMNGRDLTHEADLYSLGAVLHHILTGRHLFEDSDLRRLKDKYLSASPQSTGVGL